MTDARANPTSIVSYSHSNPGWTKEQDDERLQHVLRLVWALMDYGIDADADVFHQNEDWTRWGPGKVSSCDFILIVVSQAWKIAWEGTGDLQKYKGVRAEADAVRSIEQLGKDVFQQRCRLIMLPDSGDDDIPVGLHGILRHRLDGFAADDLELLIRDLTKQPKYVRPPLGEIPALPPTMTATTREATPAATNQDTPADPPIASTDDHQARISHLKEQLAVLPLPLPGEGPHLPWYRLRQQIEGQLWTELNNEVTTATVARDTAIAAIDWIPVRGVTAAWVDSWTPAISCGQTTAVLHLIPTPQVPLSQRTLSFLDDTMTRLVRNEELVDSGVGLTHAFSGDNVVIEADTPAPINGNEVKMGEFLGCRVGRSGQVSVWFSLPHDRFGPVLDQHRLAHDLEGAVHAGAELLKATAGASVGRVTLAAELVQTTGLTGGTLEELGNRSSANLPGAFGQPVRVDPDEAVEATALQKPQSWGVASILAKVLVRAWKH